MKFSLKLLCFVGFIFHSSFVFANTATAPSSLRESAKERWLQGDYEGVISLLEPWSKKKIGPYGNERDALRILLATSYEEREDWLLAANQYRIVKRNGRILSKYAQLQEPRSQLEGGNFWSAKKTCDIIRRKYPDHDQANKCLIILGEASGELGQLKSSEQFFSEYIKLYPKSPYKESFQLKLAEYTYRKNKKKGYALLYELFFYHSYPTTDIKVQEILGESIPLTTLEERTARIYSFIRGNRLDEAWALFQAIREKESLSSAEENWIASNIVNISWKTRQFDDYITEIQQQYSVEATSEKAWKIFRAHSKAGHWKEASSWAKQSIEKHGKTGRWAGSKKLRARANMLAGDYKAAAAIWASMWGEEAKFYRAFSLYMNKEYEAAILSFRSLQRSKTWDAAASYWLGRSLEKLGRDATDAYQLAEQKDSSGWYDLLIAQHPPEEAHNGIWNHTRRHHLVPSPLIEIQTQKALALYRPEKQSSAILWERFNTPEQAQVPTSPALPPTSIYKKDFPDGYRNTVFGTQEELETFFVDFTKTYKNDFPFLPETQALISIGLYPEAARNMALFADIISSTSKYSFSLEERRALYLFSRNHHHSLRTTTGMKKYFEDATLQKEIEQINHPIVRASDMWNFTERYNVDPYLMLGLMRQESAYREGVRSWVGAIGYIQVMPATGAKIAFLLNDEDYTPKRLERPRDNLKYGIFYFSKLMERFDGCFPLAVGSYNGGPHNMSRWYRNRLGTWNLDEFVEHIPYDETRRYIKKVTGNYASYVHLYQDSVVHIPKAPLKDDPSVINF